jgi:hypothetical protein
MCEDSQDAGSMDLPESRLRSYGLDDPSWWWKDPNYPRKGAKE